jgi:hypothetical protein
MRGLGLGLILAGVGVVERDDEAVVAVMALVSAAPVADVDVDDVEATVLTLATEPLRSGDDEGGRIAAGGGRACAPGATTKRGGARD